MMHHMMIKEDKQKRQVKEGGKQEKQRRHKTV
jgi:hypothetical protein